MTTRTEPAAVIAISRHVAIFGGDDRVRDLEGMLPGEIRVDAYPNRDGDANRLEESIKSGTVTHVILLVKWLGHAVWRRIVNVAKANGVKVIHWNHGLGKLEDELAELVASGNGGATEDETERQWGGTVRRIHTVKPNDEETALLHQRARAAGLTVACFREQHDACGYRGKRTVKCGCDCHAHDQVVEEEQGDVVGQPPPQFVISGERVLEVMGLDEGRTWTVDEVGALLDARDDEQRETVQRYVASLVESGHLHAVGPVRLVPSSVEAVRLPTTEKSHMAQADANGRAVNDGTTTGPPLDVLSLLSPERQSEIFIEAVGGELKRLIVALGEGTVGDLVDLLTSHPHWKAMKQIPASFILNDAARTVATPIETESGPSSSEVAPTVPASARAQRGRGTRAPKPGNERRLSPSESEELRQRVLAELGGAPKAGLAAATLAADLGVGIEAVQYAMKRLRAAGKVRMSGQRSGARWHLR
jgi:hypothetical protein